MSQRVKLVVAWTVTRFSTNSASANIVALASQTLEIGVAEAHQITETTYRAVGYDDNNQLQGQEFLEFNQFRPSDLDQIVNRPTVRLGNSAYGEASRFTLDIQWISSVYLRHRRNITIC